eukprot:737414-Rhodomonas_salina.1
MQCERWVVVSRKQQRLQPPRRLTDSGQPHDLLTPDEAKVYQKGWYAHGDKKTFGGGVLQYWTAPDAPAVDFDQVSEELPFEYRDVAPPDVLAYQDWLPSGPYWQWQGKPEELQLSLIHI